MVTLFGGVGRVPNFNQFREIKKISDRITHTSENISLTSYYVRGRFSTCFRRKTGIFHESLEA